MVELAYLALLIAPIVGLILIAQGRGKPRYAAAFIVFAWLLLPVVSIKVAEGIPLYDKSVAVGLGVLLGMLVGRPMALFALRPSWIDLPMTIWCLAPIASSVSNDLGLYDGLSGAFRQAVIWGAPYLIGRALFGSYEGLFELARMLFLGAVAYLPPILLESRLSPQLHRWIYGVAARAGFGTVAFFGPLKSKPSVFLQSTLELTPLMGAAALCGWWLWKTGKLRRIGGYPSGLLVAAASLSCILGKGLGGFSVTLAAGGVLFLSKKYQRKIFLAVFLTVSPLYLVTRSAGIWSGENLVSFITDNISEDRAGSFNVRLVSEDLFLVKTNERPFFGWAGWGRGFTFDQYGKELSVPDGMWIIAVNEYGYVGLIGLYASLLLPVAVVLRRANGRLLWNEPAAAGVFVLMVIVVLHSIDDLANAMPNSVYFTSAGGLTTLAVEMRNRRLAAQDARRIQSPRARRAVLVQTVHPSLKGRTGCI